MAYDFLERRLETFRPYLERFNVSGPRYTSYPTAPHFSNEFTAEEYAAAIERCNAAPESAPISLYTHLPFCSERCTFCGCYVIITPKKQISHPYVEHLYREIDLLAAKVDTSRMVEQFHYGGGTPTYLTPEQLTALTNRYLRHFTLSPTAEVSIEVDPRETSFEHVDALVEQGFNRFSMGVQDFDVRVQEAVNRLQGHELTANLVRHIRERGVKYVNIDLIYGLPFQTLEGFDETLGLIIDLKPTRLAVYSYAHVPWMKGHQKNFSEADLPQGEDKLALFLLAQKRLEDAGYVSVGFDHFALPEDELTKAQQHRTLHRNFMGYTTKAGCDLHGLGVSAISSIGNAYSQNLKKLPPYYAAVDDNTLPVDRGMTLTRDDEIRRDFITQLFCNYYLDRKAFGEKWSLDVGEYFKDDLPKLRDAIELEMVTVDDNRIEVTGMGKVFVRNICMAFDAYYKADGSGARYSKTI